MVFTTVVATTLYIVVSVGELDLFQEDVYILSF